ncbi:MAG: polysaccharide biosynthesis/export family protein, partial [Roseibacillus sp.]|nr:polysaccharide biosynthesis/export family protein [Roseibacillus sp.]
MASLIVPLFGADKKSYVFKAGDGVSLEVYNEPDLATETRILKSGEVSFPLIGKVILEGLSVTEGVAKIYELYNKDYLVKPKLTLTVTE